MLAPHWAHLIFWTLGDARAAGLCARRDPVQLGNPQAQRAPLVIGHIDRIYGLQHRAEVVRRLFQ
jgi:hypothetical protein